MKKFLKKLKKSKVVSTLLPSLLFLLLGWIDSLFYPESDFMFDAVFAVVYFWVVYGIISVYNAAKRSKKRKITGKSRNAASRKRKKNKNPDKYIYPIIRIVVSLLFMVLMVLINFCINPENEIIDGFIAFVVLVSLLLGFASIFIAVSQMFAISDSREKQKLKNKTITQEDCVEKSKSEIKTLLRENDIIEFAILSEKKLLLMGTSSKSDSPSGEFYDKKYYSNGDEYDTFDSFCLALDELFYGEILYVYSIDGVKLKKKQKKKSRV